MIARLGQHVCPTQSRDLDLIQKPITRATKCVPYGVPRRNVRCSQVTELEHTARPNYANHETVILTSNGYATDMMANTPNIDETLTKLMRSSLYHSIARLATRLFRGVSLPAPDDVTNGGLVFCFAEIVNGLRKKTHAT